MLGDRQEVIRVRGQECSGNPEKLGTAAEGWAATATELGEIAEELRSAVNSDLAEWLGDDGDAARQRLSEFASVIDGITNDVNGISVVLGLSVALMEAAQAIILTIISTFVSWLIITWLAAFATSELTLGGINCRRWCGDRRRRRGCDK